MVWGNGRGKGELCLLSRGLFCPLGRKSEARSDQEGLLGATGDTELVEFLSRWHDGNKAVLQKVAVV